jgi:hypothetical protein
MRVFMTTTVAQAEAIFRNGYTNLCAEFGREGVYWSDSPLGAADGFDGEVVLSLDVSDELFQGWDVPDELTPGRLALIPAEVLNRIGKPQVHDHQFAGSWRREEVQAIQSSEAADSVAGRRAAKAMRDAKAFFDRIGWLRPVSPQEVKE